MPALPSLASISRFYLFTWLGVVAHVTRFTSRGQYADPGTALWTLATTATYSMFYLLPAIAVGYLTYWLLRLAKGWRYGNRTAASEVWAFGTNGCFQISPPSAKGTKCEFVRSGS